MKKIVLGSIVALSTYTGLVYAAQVFTQDVIVQGSECVGIDCSSSESFGFDTLRLKENNLRIKFDDTSTSASFPSNDWQLTANESDNGGLNKFSIDDVTGNKTPFTIIAGAPSDSLYVDSTGRVGLGTSAPVVNAHIKEGNTPTLRLEQDGSSGFTPQTWDMAGNETNFFIRDVTNGSKLPFKILPGAPDNSLYTNADGDIGLGSTSFPSHALHQTKLMIQGNSGEHNSLTFNSASADKVSSIIFSKQNAPLWYFSSRNDLGNDRFGIYDESIVERFSLFQGGQIGFGVSSVDAANAIEHSNGARLTTGGVWTDASSRSLKDNIIGISVNAALKALSALEPVTFSYKAQPEETYAGFIAEDVPEMVATNDRKGLAPMDIVAVLTKVVQDQQKTINKLKLEQSKTLEALNDRLSQLEASQSN